jgi:hypothetical protein
MATFLRQDGSRLASVGPASHDLAGLEELQAVAFGHLDRPKASIAKWRSSADACWLMMT